MAHWQLDLEGLLPHQAIALQARIADYLADVASAVGYTGERGMEDLRFVAAARQAGIDGDLLEALRRERQFKTGSANGSSTRSGCALAIPGGLPWSGSSAWT